MDRREMGWEISGDGDMREKLLVYCSLTAPTEQANDITVFTKALECEYYLLLSQNIRDMK